MVFGLILLHAGTAVWRDVPGDLLAKYSDPSTPVAVILCRPSDVPAAAGSNTRWEDFFLPGGRDPANVSRYWTELSFGQYDANGSRVFDWIDIGHTQAEIGTFSGQQQRQQLAAWGRQAATASGITLAGFTQVVFGYNMNADHGSVGGNSVVLGYAEGRPFEPTFIHHEMGHALGPLNHSSSTADVVYEDHFDIMSAMRVFMFQDSLGRGAGPGAAAINLENLGHLHRSRVWRGWPLNPQTIQLAALNRPDVDGYLAARVAFGLPFDPPFYLEYREPTAWDRGLPGPRVLVQTRNSANGAEIFGSGWTPVGALSMGTELVFPDFPFPVVVRVERVDESASRATVRIWALTSPGQRTVRVAGILYDPPGVEWQQEYALVRNDGPAPVDITDWTLSDVAGHKYTFSSPTGAPGPLR